MNAGVGCVAKIHTRLRAIAVWLERHFREMEFRCERVRSVSYSQTSGRGCRCGEDSLVSPCKKDKGNSKTMKAYAKTTQPTR